MPRGDGDGRSMTGVGSGSGIEVATTEPEVVLTYDDGPSPRGTREVLEALAERDATATFFVLTNRCRRYPEVLGEVLGAGHEIGLHGPDHRRLTDFNPVEVGRRTREARDDLQDRIGRCVRWFRPPYGRQTPEQWQETTACGLVSVSWTADTADWRTAGQEQRVQAALRAARPGAILLAHDAFADAADGVDDGAAPVVDRGDLTRRVADAFHAHGLRLRSLGGVLERGSEVRAPWFVR